MRHEDLLAKPILCEDDFRRLNNFVYARCGNVIGSKKRTRLETCVRKRMQILGMTDAAQYCRMLLDKNDLAAEEEGLLFIDAITINKTEFFRETAHFTLLRTQLLPDLLAQQRPLIKVWSAACANGCEPYSLAMTLEEFSRTHGPADYFVLGTDISATMISAAASACYPEAVMEQIPIDMRHQHLMRAKDANRRQFRIAPHLREKVAFIRLNLTAEKYPLSKDYDIIFCRNVLIYFDKPTQERVLTHLLEHLHPDGFLVLGHSESTTGMRLALSHITNTIFRKR